MLELKLEPVNKTPIQLNVGAKLESKLVLSLANFYRGLPGDTSVQVLAGGPIGGHRVVVLEGALAQYATNQNPQHGMKVLGVTTNAAAAGGTLSVVRSGKVSEPSWSFDTLKPVFLGVDGLLTQVAPTHPAAAFSLIVGFPLSATELFVGLREPLGLGA